MMPFEAICSPLLVGVYDNRFTSIARLIYAIPIVKKRPSIHPSVHPAHTVVKKMRKTLDGDNDEGKSLASLGGQH